MELGDGGLRCLAAWCVVTIRPPCRAASSASLEDSVQVPVAQECSRHRCLPGTGCGDRSE